MNFENLQLFCDVVRCKSFSRGAENNGISQSAASQAINHLETELGTQLIDRRRRPFVLTAEGEICYQGACEILQRFESLKANVKSVRQKVSGTIRVAAIYSIGLYRMNEVMQTFMARYPESRVRLKYHLPDEVYQMVLDGSVDLGIVSYPTENREITVIPLRSEKMVLVCHPEHHLARKKTIPINQLDGENFVAFNRELAICREVDRQLRENRVSVRKVMEFDNIDTIKQAIEIGVGLSILPEPTIHREVEQRSLVAIPLSNCDLIRPIGIIHEYRKVFTPIITRFIDMLRGTEET